MDYEILTVFSPTGATFTFRSVRVVLDNESGLVFDYNAMSDGLRKRATFSHRAILGYSTTS